MSIKLLTTYDLLIYTYLLGIFTYNDDDDVDVDDDDSGEFVTNPRCHYL